ncbi:hypothetical protein SAMN05518682_3084 [Cellulosimicrobium aquatile]|uniref:Uncharacterized protein n=1 Tax=Cellulosimicrobium aquatile TaxID=1612203 RepID=A0A1N6UBW6_9MICO|nr:DUF5701 family protein [Cellulosimicrobium aquatile]SIQ63073.1 hypothetical protein SAMN05518682_3084 [Cellulosimicrobium aquatile]
MPEPTTAATRPASPAAASAPPALPPLPDVVAQAERLVALGVHDIAVLTADAFRAAAADLAATAPAGALLVVDPALAPPSALAPLLRLPAKDGEKEGFVVVDMTDVDRFTPIEGIVVPPGPLSLVTDVDRGDDLASWSPDEALPELTARGRTPLLLHEGIHWALQAPDVLARNHCYMTVGSRLRKPDGRLDTRTPALWISNGTGRDGRERRGAPKVGWCWAGNRHTWLGFASATGRLPA